MCLFVKHTMNITAVGYKKNSEIKKCITENKNSIKIIQAVILNYSVLVLFLKYSWLRNNLMSQLLEDSSIWFYCCVALCLYSQPGPLSAV